MTKKVSDQVIREKERLAKAVGMSAKQKARFVQETRDQIAATEASKGAKP